MSKEVHRSRAERLACCTEESILGDKGCKLPLLPKVARSRPLLALQRFRPLLGDQLTVRRRPREDRP